MEKDGVLVGDRFDAYIIDGKPMFLSEATRYLIDKVEMTTTEAAQYLKLLRDSGYDKADSVALTG